MIRKAFKLAQTERPGAVYLAVPEDIESAPAPRTRDPCAVNVPRADEPSPSQVARAASILRAASNPIVLAGHGAARADAGPRAGAVRRALGRLGGHHLPRQGRLPRRPPAGARRDRVHASRLRQLRVRPGRRRSSRSATNSRSSIRSGSIPKVTSRSSTSTEFPAEVDRHYNVAVGLQADISRSLDALAAALDWHFENQTAKLQIRGSWPRNWTEGAADDRFPMAPARIVADTRAAHGPRRHRAGRHRALKMWMARLYPTYAPNTCLISNGLSTMAWTLPGAIGAKMARPEASVLVATGDGGFLMNSQEIETALRERIPMVILIWVDDAYGLISWKMDLELGHHVDTTFGNPDFVAYAESFGANGYEITSPDELLPTLQAALADDTVSVIACPVDYSANLELIRSLGELDESLS